MSTLTEWQIYAHINDAMRAGDFQSAIRRISETREETSWIRSSIAVLESQCATLLGDHDKALSILEFAAENYSHNYWVYHNLASLYRERVQKEDCIKAYRKAHGLIGWQESEQNGYIFLLDYFSFNIPSWSKWFAERITTAPIDVLEIGSWQGGSATWLLDKVIAKRGGRLTCIDPFEGGFEYPGWIGGIDDTNENIFDHNIAASGHAGLCRKIVGYSQDVLRTLHQERFDFMYIDGAHEARQVIEDAVLAFGLLKEGGYICFDDYNFTFPDRPRQNTACAIDAFLALYEGDISFVEMGRQVLLRKAGSTDRRVPEAASPER